ncbi:HAD family hydrolase [Robbsia andropogonis]|uniref:HAD family hydrolase n=1 Tax=Robbsia andropogonis TaxID=28092 RepID=UPI0004640F86|nr:HAD family phosphatase [Robbsia andropogonis]
MKETITVTHHQPDGTPAVHAATGPGTPAIKVPASPVTHLVCDCDGVLVDSEAVADEAMVTALFATLTAAQSPQAVTNRPITHAAVETEVGARLGLTIDHVIAAVADCFGITLTAAAQDSVRLAVEAAVRARQTAVPGVTQALHALAASDLPLAVASNSTLPRVQEAVVVAGIAELVGERIYTGERVAHPKPAPDVYVAACAGFKAPPAQCAAVEDSVTGVTAAAGAGMQVIGFAGGTHLGDARAHATLLHAAGASWVFEDMRHLTAILAALRAGKAPEPRYLLL